MATYRLTYLIDSDKEARESEQILPRSASALQIAIAVARAIRPNDQGEVDAVINSLGEGDEDLSPVQDLMAQLGILEIRYNIDGRTEEHLL
ncbi:hypothetical protein [Herbaspirillum huttiense]|uniref:hypothetical protein n=1 Tax=Herbaspirillum huttiense TaxID=863372 RepID=UPI002176B304|nr:hypothetical protein [Herbaspirillum huttiense]UWE19375.1 hypothetical protein NY669_26735 [Herbaspirillum huttiense]